MHPTPGQPQAPQDDILEDSVVPPQDGFRKVYMGEIADPLFPAHPEPAETPEDELTQAALADPGHAYPEHPQPAPTAWRMVMLLLLGAGALAYVFWKR